MVKHAGVTQYPYPCLPFPITTEIKLKNVEKITSENDMKTKNHCQDARGVNIKLFGVVL